MAYMMAELMHETTEVRAHVAKLAADVAEVNKKFEKIDTLTSRDDVFLFGFCSRPPNSFGLTRVENLANCIIHYCAAKHIFVCGRLDFRWVLLPTIVRANIAE